MVASLVLAVLDVGQAFCEGFAAQYTNAYFRYCDPGSA